MMVKKSRGRPRKSIASTSSSPGPSVKRGRGRPPGILKRMSGEPPHLRPQTPQTSSGKKRGRKPKVAKQAEQEEVETEDNESDQEEPVQVPKRGRPKKLKTKSANSQEPVKPKGKRGRPKKLVEAVESDGDNQPADDNEVQKTDADSDQSLIIDDGEKEDQGSECQPKKKAGRPKKVKKPESEDVEPQSDGEKSGDPKTSNALEPATEDEQDTEVVETPKRGRGRPKKVKKVMKQKPEPEVEEVEQGSDGGQPAEEKPDEKPKKRRGRPKKVVEQKEDDEEVEDEEEEKRLIEQLKKNFQLQKDVEMEVIDVSDDSGAEDEPKSEPQKRGLKRKVEIAVPDESETKDSSVAEVVAEAPKRKRGRPPKKSKKEDDYQVEEETPEDPDEVATTIKSEVVKVSTMATSSGSAVVYNSSSVTIQSESSFSSRKVTPPTSKLPRQILEDEESDEEEEEEKKEEEEEENEQSDEKSDSEDDAEDGGAGSGNNGATESGDSDGHDDHNDDAAEESSDDEAEQEDEKSSGNSAGYSNRAVHFVTDPATGLLSYTRCDLQMLWAKLAVKLSIEMLTDYKNKLQLILTGRASSLKPIGYHVPGFPSSLVHVHDKLYNRICELSGAYPFQNYKGSTLISKYWLADHTKIGAQIALELLSRGISPTDVLNKPSVFKHIQDIVRIGIKDMLDEANSQLPRHHHHIRPEHIPMTLTTRLLAI